MGAGNLLPPVVAVLIANISEFSAKMGEAKGEMASVEGTAGKLGAFGKTALLGLAAGAVAVGAESVKMASSFQATMELIATQAHAGQQEVDNMSKAVLALAPTVGIGPEKLAEGLYHVESTGLRGQAALDVLKASAQEAALGMADFDSVTYAMSGVMSIAMKDVNSAADGVAYLNTIVGTGDMRMQDLANAIGTGVLPVFKNAGLGMRDFGAALTVMTDNSMPAEVSANHLKTAIQLLQVQSKPAQEALAKLGIGAGQLSADLKKPDGLLVATEDLKAHVDAAAKHGVDAGALLSKAFGGARSASTVMELVEEADKLKGKYQEMGGVAERARQQQEDWANTQKTFKQKMAEVGAQFQVWAIEIGQKLLPILSKMADWFMKTVSWLGAHQDVLIAFGSVALAAVAVGLYMVTAAVWDFTVALLANPITWIILLIAGLIFAIIEMIKHWDWVKARWNDFINWAKGVWHGFSQFWVDLWNTVWKWVSDRITDIRNFCVNTFNDIVTGIHREWDDFLNFWKDLWNTIWKWCSDRITDVKNFVVNIFTSVIDWVKNRWDDFSNWWHGLWHEAVLFCAQKLVELRGWIHDRVQQAKDAIVEKFNEAVDFVKSIPGRILDALGNLGHLLWQAGSDIISGLLNGIKSAASAVWDFVSGIAGKIASLKGPLDYDRQLLVPHGNAIMDGLHEGLMAGGQRVQAFLSGFTGEIGQTAINGTLAVAGTPGAFGIGAAALAQQQPIEITIQMNPRDVATWLQTGVLRYAMRNNGNGYTPGLATGGR